MSILAILFIRRLRCQIGLDGIGPYRQALFLGKPADAFDDLVNVSAFAEKFPLGRNIPLPWIVFMFAGRTDYLFLRELSPPLPDRLALRAKEDGQ